MPACPVTVPPPTSAPAPTPTPTPTPSSPAPVVDAGSQYAGRNSFRSYDVITVSKNGQHLTAFDIGFVHGNCSDGEPFFSEFGSNIKHGAAINSRHQVSYSTGYYSHAIFITRRGKVIKGQEEIAFTIRFTAGRLQGTARDTFRSARLRCSSGKVTFAGYPVGTSRAPLHDSTTATGTYRGHTDESGSAVSAQVYLPLRWVHVIRIAWKAYCRNGYSFRSTSTLYVLPISGSLFSIRVAGATPADRQGLSARFHYRLTGRFSVNSLNYSLQGTWEWSDGVYRAGRRRGACTTGPVTFSATGPRVP